MKKMIFVLAVLFVTAPAMAGVVVEVVDLAAGCQVNINYDANATGDIRAFGLEISADGGCTIDAVGGLSTEYNIYPGSIVIVDNEVNDPGTPVASGLGTSTVVLEMGSLEVSGAASGTLCTLTLSGACNVSIAENAARGGVVMEDVLVDADATLKGGAVTSCAPACWTDCQLLGDANMSDSVNIADLGALKAAWLSTPASPNWNECADFDRSGGVNIADLGKLKQNWLATCP